jgi:hypothetical protein
MEMVGRGLVQLQGPRTFVSVRVTVPLARCDGTRRGHRSRVLPGDILPRKTYALGVQEAAMDGYGCSGDSLRATLSSFTGEVPHSSTLHRWLAGLGRYALGRSTPEGVLPVGALLEATRRQRSAEGLEVEPVPVHPARYRSEARREELEMGAGLLVLAEAIFPDRPEPLSSWRCLILRTEGVGAISWSTGSRSTAMQHRIRDGP